MRLKDIESQEQMLRQLKSGDDELADDIRRELTKEWNRVEWYESQALEEIVEQYLDEIVDLVLQYGEGLRYSAALEDVVRSELREHIVGDPKDRRRGLRSDWYSFGGSSRDVGDRPNKDYISVEVMYFTHIKLEGELAWVPGQHVMEVLNDVGWAEWELEGPPDDDGSVLYLGTSTSPEHLWVGFDVDYLQEAITDIAIRTVSELLEKDKKAGLERFLQVLQEDDKELAARVKKAKFPQDVLIDLATAYFADDDGVQVLREAVGMFGYEGTRGKLITEVTAVDLQELGVERGGKWMQGAPWKLLNLPPQELAYEGTLMRHCVGQYKMGYRQAVEDGKTEIWSLRSRYNIPILTFEVDAERWMESWEAEAAAREAKEAAREAAYEAEDEAERKALWAAVDDAGKDFAKDRGEAIAQVRGKLNRYGGSADGGGSNLAYSEQELVDETKVLQLIFERLSVDASKVWEFHPTFPE
jgi:hypothetical protein